MFTRNGTSKGQIVVKQDAFRVIDCIVYAQLLSEHKTVVKKEDHRVAQRQIFQDNESGRPVRANKFIWANQIIWTNKFIRDKFIRANQIVRTNKIARDRSDRFIMVTFLEVIEKIRR